MNGEVCCILGVCCPPNSSAQSGALATELVKDGVCTERAEAEHIAAWMFTHFDLAPAGTLSPLVTAIAKMAKHAAK